MEIEAAAAVSRHDERHIVQFYDKSEFLIEQVVEFLGTVLLRGGAALAVVSPSHAQALRERLPAFLGPTGDTRDLSRRLIILDAQQSLDAFMVGDEPDEARFAEIFEPLIERASQSGRVPVRAFGEMVALLCNQGLPDAAVQLEEIWNRLAGRRSFSLLCGYPLRLFASSDRAAVFRSICAQHHQVSPVETFRHVADDADSSLRLALLQQKAVSLEAEIHKRQRAESELQHRERELADFLENAVEGLQRIGPRGDILWANAAQARMLGYEAGEYIGRSIQDFHADREEIAALCRKLKAGQTLRDEPSRMRSKDGTFRDVRINANAYFDKGELVYMRWFTHDVTEQVRARQVLERSHAEREQLLKELESACRAKDEFLAMLGHELRNPLSPIVTALHLMKLRGNTGKEHDIIERQVTHLTRLVDDLLDVARVTQGKIELRREVHELSEVVAKAVEMAGPLVEQRKHLLSVDVPGSGMLCESDPVRLAQVLSNLLTNAARYTEPGGRIHLSACREGAAITIRVKDNGRGIAKDVLPHIFDTFYQSNRTVERAAGGLGLGLALVRTLVELHGGSVEASSPGRGRGSEFVVRLPAPVMPSPDPAAERSRGAGPADEPTPTRTRRILVVDDNQDAADLLGSLLKQSGHQVLVAYDPAQAMSQAERFRPEIALLDIGLPVMDGHELARELRKKLGAGCRFIAMTGYGQAVDKTRSDGAGFEHHLVKPVDPLALISLLESLRAPH